MLFDLTLDYFGVEEGNRQLCSWFRTLLISGARISNNGYPENSQDNRGGSM